MKIEEMIEKLRYKANNIKAKIEPEFFNEVADRLEIQIAKEPLDVNIIEKDSFYKVEFICSNCEGAVYGQPYKPNNCKHCGQKILWKGEADE